MSILSFEGAEAYLRGTINETASRRFPNRLDRMRGLLTELGDPQLRYPTIHVAGTSGKGSTSTMIAAALSVSGRRTGLHTKPHLGSVTERARVDGVPVSKDHFGDILGEMQPALDATAVEHERPSYYETLLALAYVAFAEAQVDVAVIEAGIGGRLDGTNLLSPSVTAITNVGLDHTDVLGETIVEIAADKAGIAKRGVPLVTDAREPDAKRVIERICGEVGAPFIAVEDHATIEARAAERYAESFGVRTERGSYDIALPIVGSFQRRNAATAILVLEQLEEALRPTIAQIETGLSRTMLPGRMEFFPSHPSIVFDIAHNADKSASLAAALAEAFPGRRFSFVIAIGESKDARAILEPLAALRSTFTFTTFESDGATAHRTQRLAGAAGESGAWGRQITDPVEALAVARRGAEADDIVVVTGSTYLVAELRDWWLANVVSSSRS